MKKVFQDLILDPLKYSGTLMASPFPDPLSSPCMEMKTSSLGVLVVFLNGCFSYVCVCMFEKFIVCVSVCACTSSSWCVGGEILENA